MKSIVFFLAIFLLTGCGDGVTLYPAKGTILLQNGQPVLRVLSNASLLIIPRSLMQQQAYKKMDHLNLKLWAKKERLRVNTK
jgi:hypothetical protein